jgi:nitroreductase
MTEFYDAVRRRRMVRNYTAEPVDHDALHRIVEAGRRAPSAGNTQGQSFVVVTSEAGRRAIAELAGEPDYMAAGFDPWISRAPAHVVICVSEDAYHNRYREPDKVGPDGREKEWPVPFWWVDAGASMMAILLATVAEGLAAGFLGLASLPGISEALDIPETVAPIGVVTIGHPAPDRRSGSLARGRRPSNEVVHYERWGSGGVTDTTDKRLQR